MTRATRVPRWVTAAAMVLVLIVVLASFALSFTVLRDLASLSGIPHGVAWLWPVIVDGTIAAATLVFYTSRGRGRGQAPLTLILFGLASVVGNVAHILLVDPTRVIPAAIAVFVGVMPPVGLILTVELLGSLLRSTPGDEVHESPVAQPVAETEPVDEPELAQGSEHRLTSEPDREPASEPMPTRFIDLGHDAAAAADPHEPADEPTGPSGDPAVRPVPTPVISTARDEPAVSQADEPPAEVTAQPLVHGEPSTEPVVEPEPPVTEREPIPETVEDQVAWVADQARAGAPVTASTLVDRFAESGIDLSLSTVKRRLSAARQEHPDAFEIAS